MQSKSWSIEGIIHGLGLLFITVVYTLYMRFAIQLFNVEPLIFTGIGLMTGAFILMIAAGPGRLGKETLYSPATWFYSLLLIITYAADMLVMQYITATESALLFNLSVPYAMFIAWVWMKRSPDMGDKIGLMFMLVSMAIVLWLQPQNLVMTIFVLALINAMADASRLFIAETHREANIANQHGAIRDKARVMGFVTFAASLTFLGALLMLAIIFGGAENHLLGLTIPSLQQFSDPETIFAGILFGITVVPLIRYFMWSSAFHLKAESVATLVAFMPGLVLVSEWLLSVLFNLEFNTAAFSGERGVWLLAATVIMCLGAAIQALSKTTTMEDKNFNDIKRKLLRGEDRALASGYQPTARDDYEAVTTTLEQCGNDTKLAARLLDVPPGALEAVLASAGRQAFHPTVAARVARNFRHNVALADPLTGLHNRLSFMNALRQLLTSKKPLALLFIDLNKFKPVNDTYGHEAGDAVLKTIGQRLQNAAPQGSLVARLGGDEFVVTLSGGAIKNATQLTQDILAAIQEPILLTSDLPPVELDAAIGKAHYPLDAKTAEDLIKQADKLMYKNKGKR